MYKVFMMEDDEVVAEVYKDKIRDEGYIVEIAFDGKSGYDKMKSFKPDILLLDLMLPGMPGIDVLKMLRRDKRFRNLPIIAFSGDESNGLLDRAKKFGATRVLSKGEFTPSQIVARITETLSAHAPPHREEDVVTHTMSEWQQPTGRILVLEDDPVIMALVKDIVEQEGYAVVSAADGREAYKILSTDSNFVGGIFDVNVPLIEGPDLIKHMRSEKRLMRIPILVMTGNEGLQVQAQSFSAGAAMFVTKPFTRASLKTMVHTLIDQGTKPLAAPTVKV